MSTPMRRTHSPCCALAASGHAAAAPPSAVSNSRRPMVTVMRPPVRWCVNATIPRHERAVFTAIGTNLAIAIAPRLFADCPRGAYGRRDGLPLPPIAPSPFSPNGIYGISRGEPRSVRLDVGRLDHLAPLLGLSRPIRAKLRRAKDRRNDCQFGKTSFDSLVR